MAKMKRLDVILIDDKYDVFESLQLKAAMKGIILHHTDNGEEGFALYESSSKFKGIILDGQCYRNKEQISKGDKAEMKFLVWAIDKLKEYKLNGSYIPAVAYTAHGDAYEPLIPGKLLDIYQKDQDTDQMLDRLRFLINTSEEQKLKIKFKDPFKVFEKGYLSKKSESTLIGMVKKYDSPKLEDINNFISSIRPFFEAIFTKINQTNTNKVYAPDEHFQYEKININRLIKNLAGKPTYENKHKPTSDVLAPKVVTTLMSNLYNLSNDDGAHFSEYQTDRYFFRSQLNALLEILVWFGRWMDENVNGDK
jgi:hypothetical protein